jgi:UBX domain-containing protein 1/4
MVFKMRLPTGATLTQTFPSDTPLSTVYEYVATHVGGGFKLMTTFPRKVLDERTKTLKELGLVPSAALAVVA